MRPATPQPADILGRTPRLAATLKEGVAAEDDTWRDFALVALDLAGQRPLDEIPRADRSSDGGSLRGTEESRRVKAAGRKAMCGGSMSDTREVSCACSTRPADDYLVTADFADYFNTHRRVDALYQRRADWAEACIMNIAGMGWFSSDRAIRTYAEVIWQAPLSR